LNYARQLITKDWSDIVSEKIYNLPVQWQVKIHLFVKNTSSAAPGHIENPHNVFGPHCGSPKTFYGLNDLAFSAEERSWTDICFVQDSQRRNPYKSKSD